jgi:hypothetical protein
MNLEIQEFGKLKIGDKQFSVILFLLYILFGISFSVSAQSFKAAARIDTNTIKIGEQFHLILEAQAPAGFKFIFPQVPDTITKLEITDRSKIDTAELQDKKIYTYKQIITVTCFDSGYYPVPPFVFSYQQPGDTAQHTFETEALLVSVQGVAVDTSKNIRDIKKPLNVPFIFEEAIPYILSALGVAILVLLIIYLKKKFKRKEVVRKVFIPTRPPHEIALEELKKLEAERLWQQGLIKQYHSRITDIVRTYIEYRYGVIAMEMPTGEILEALSRAVMEKESSEKLSQFLQLADMVKFAKVQPLPGENEMSMQQAYDFINATKEMKKEIAKPETEATVS